MDPTDQDITVVEQDSIDILVTVQDKLGTRVDLTPFQAIFIVKADVKDADGAAKITKKTLGLGGSTSEIEYLDQGAATTKGQMLIHVLPDDNKLLARSFLYTVKILNIPVTTKRYTVVSGNYIITKSLVETVTAP